MDRESADRIVQAAHDAPTATSGFLERADTASHRNADDEDRGTDEHSLTSPAKMPGADRTSAPGIPRNAEADE